MSGSLAGVGRQIGGDYGDCVTATPKERSLADLVRVATNDSASALFEIGERLESILSRLRGPMPKNEQGAVNESTAYGGLLGETRQMHDAARENYGRVTGLLNELDGLV